MGLKKLLISTVFGLMTFYALGQEAIILKSNAFSIETEFSKQLKKFPLIKIAEAPKNKSVKVIKEIIYSNDEVKLHLDAYINHSKKTKPAVIFIHGGGWSSGHKEMNEPMAIALAQKGFQCFSIQYQLSDEAKYPAALNDVEKAINFIKKMAIQYQVDTAKIAILGCSSGGQMATLFGAKNNAIKAIVNIDGILAFHHPESKEDVAASHWLGGSYKEVPHIWHEASPLSHTSKNFPPILFINSSIPRFHAGRDDLIKKLNIFKVQSEIKTFEDSPHTFWLFHPWFHPTIKAITKFLNNQLK